MPAPVPQLKANAIIEQVSSIIVSATTYLSPDDMVIRRLLREAEDSIVAYPAAGHSALACVYQLVGDAERTKYHIDNAIRLSNDLVWVVNRSAILSNLGFASEGQKSFKAVVAPENGWMKVVWNQGFALGAYRTMNDALVGARKLKLDIEQLDASTVERAAKVMEKLNLSDADVALIFDAAGEILRKRRLFYLGQAPRTVVWDGDGRMPFIKIIFKTSSSPQATQDMYLELVDKVLERSLIAHSAVSVEFEGATASDERKAA